MGIPLKTYRYTKDKIMLKYARLLVEMPLDGSFPEYIEFANEKDVLIRQRVVYEWLPIKCSHYSMFGHTQDVCRKKEFQRKEWRLGVQPATQVQQLPEDHHEQQDPPEEGKSF